MGILANLFGGRKGADRMYVRCRNVDAYGWNGREHHPRKHDIGRTFPVLSMEMYVWTEYGEEPIKARPSHDILTVLNMNIDPMNDTELDEFPMYFYECIDRQTGRRITFVDTEVEVV